MSKHYYSASTRGFYVDEIHGSRMPADAKEISEEEWLALLQQQAAGRQIVPDEDGRPIPVVPGVQP